jgi:hypothetical protein
MNGLQRGAAEVTVQMWSQPHALICEVVDDTMIDDLLLAAACPLRMSMAVWPVKSAGLHSGFSWSRLWSHSCKFSGVRSGLPSLGSGATEPNPSCLNHQPQNSIAREGQPSAGSNPAATASLT